MIDLHTHILPAFDDGADEIEESLAMAQIAASDGITHLCASPHIVDGLYKSTREEILTAVADLNQLLQEKQIELQIIPAAEYRLEPDLPQRLSRGELLTINDTGKYLLVEMPITLIPDYTEDILYYIQLQGVTPIIAHPERSPFELNLPRLRQLVQRGIMTQLTAGSLTGRFGRTAEKTAWSLLQESIAHFIASDAHSATGRIPSLSSAHEKVASKLGSDLADELTQINPQLVLEGNSIPVRDIPSTQSSLDYIKKLFSW